MKFYIFCALFGAPFTTLALPAPLPNPAPLPTPPNIPSYSTASNQLALLTVAPQGPQTGYSRDKFPHWSSQSGTCDTREVVLKRDGSNVVQSSSCAAASGSWFSPYDGATWTLASDVDIDHVVPLSNAWKVCQFRLKHRFPPMELIPKTSLTPECLVRSGIMERRRERSVCQRPHPSSTDCGDG